MLDNVVELLNEINKMPEPDLLNKLVSYCEQNDLDEQELGEILGECDQFKRQLWIDGVKHFQIKDEGVQRKLKSTKDIDIW